jgi:hypothetical protein
MGFKPWFRWSFVVAAGIALGGCQTPPPRQFPPPPPVGRQTQQMPPPNFPTGTGTPGTSIQGQPISTGNTLPYGGSIGQSAPVGGRAPNSTPSQFTVPQQFGTQQGASTLNTGFPNSGLGAGGVQSTGGLGNTSSTTVRTQDFSMGNSGSSLNPSGISAPTSGIGARTSMPAPGAMSTGVAGPGLAPVPPPLQPPPVAPQGGTPSFGQ